MSDLVAEILERAAALIQEGWCRGQFTDLRLIRLRSGNRWVQCYCAFGAIDLCAQSIAGTLDDRNFSELAAQHLLAIVIDSRCKERSETGVLKNAHMPTCRLITVFNDATSREAVLAVFRDAITMAYRNSAEVPQLLLTHEVSA